MKWSIIIEHAYLQYKITYIFTINLNLMQREPEDDFILLCNVHVLQYSFSRNNVCFFFIQSADPVKAYKIAVVGYVVSLLNSRIKT